MPRRSRAACWATSSRSTSSATTRCCRSTRARPWSSATSAITPFRIGHSIPDAMGLLPADAVREHHPHGRLQVRPHAGRWAASDFQALARFGAEGVLLPPVGLDPGRVARLHALRAHGRGGLPRDHGGPRRAGSSWRPSRPTSRASSRSSTPPRRSGARSRSSAGRWSRTRRIAAELGYLVAPETGLVAKDRLKDVADERLTIATTGAQGEPMAGLSRMANRDHRYVEIVPATPSS